MKFTFQHSIHFRTLGFVLCLVSLTYLCIFNELIGTVILLAVAIFCDCQYKCPFCKKNFDVRIRPDELEYCPRCGKKLI